MRKFIKVDRDLTGQKRHLLTALRKVDKNGRWYWECSCDCGGATCIREDYFLAGKTKSCGCFGSRNSVYRINRKAPCESALNSHFRSYKKAAAERNYSFKLCKEEFITIVTQDCYYCGSPPRSSPYNKTAYGDTKINGIDRVDNTLGYFLGNCIPCCKNCNVAKAQLSQSEFFALISAIYLRHLKGNSGHDV
jgi:hypothetical protein